MEHAKLGSLDVGRIGLGPMGMSFAYTGHSDDDAESAWTCGNSGAHVPGVKGSLDGAPVTVD
jgi:hypothetical protein